MITDPGHLAKRGSRETGAKIPAGAGEISMDVEEGRLEAPR
jgi:hypothetical protein